MAAQFGAHEAMELNEVLCNTIDGINHFQLVRDIVQDPQLKSILDNQLQFMTQEYNNLVQAIHQRGMSQSIPYRSPKTAAPKYGLRHPGTVAPNAAASDMDDKDVASGMLGCHKAGALIKMAAALEFADPQLRTMIQQSALNCAEQAYEVWNFMNQRGMYQVPTMMEMTTNTLMQTYNANAGTTQQTNMAPMPQ